MSLKFPIFLVVFISTTLFAQQPNLVITTGSFSPNSLSRGDQIKISATVKNIGNSPSKRSHLAFYLSPTTEVSEGLCIGCVSLEPLSSLASSELKEVTVTIPSQLPAGAYYVGWVVDRFNEVAESDENNDFYLTNNFINVTSSLTYDRHIPYPVIFIHGLNSWDKTWNTLSSWLDLLGWSCGGRMDYCLNYDGNLSTSVLENDLHDFTNTILMKNADFYTLNFDVNVDGTIYKNTVKSNQSAIFKQGKALQSAIEHVLDKTKADKVILVGHSMGGLAAREYLQNSTNWQSDGQHHIAKLLSIGTPHGGSNMPTIPLFSLPDDKSEAVRDLRWEYFNGQVGAYLFGCNESNLSSLAYYNVDINCNGNSKDDIQGLNQKGLPNNLAYSCVIGTGGLSGDFLVDASRADLNNYYKVYADTFLVNKAHWLLTDQIETNLKGMDEPSYFNQAYQIGMDTLYYGSITKQSEGNSFTDDYDDYLINLKNSSNLNIHISNIAVPVFSIAIFDNAYNRKFIKYSNSFSQIDTTVLLPEGKYFLEIVAQPELYSWIFPYNFKLHATPVTKVGTDVIQTPGEYKLFQNYPNPFNPTTTISFSIPKNEMVTLKIFDMLGKEIATLVNSELSSGSHSVAWDASKTPSGTYYYKIQAGSFIQIKKLILLK